MIFYCKSEEETQTLAKKLARSIGPGTIISLIGDLGSGKTTFTKGFAKQMGIKDHVASPTFKLISEYNGEKYKLNHIDAYRMNGPKDFLNIGGEEYLLTKKNITIIEWGDLLNDILPTRTITVNFYRIKSKEKSRKIEISGVEIVE